MIKVIRGPDKAVFSATRDQAGVSMYCVLNGQCVWVREEGKMGRKKDFVIFFNVIIILWPVIFETGILPLQIVSSSWNLLRVLPMFIASSGSENPIAESHILVLKPVKWSLN